MVADIAILGAGPSGLCLARLLEINNFNYVVFERDTHSSSIGQGGTLDVHEKSGQAALKEAGLLNKFEATARYDAQRFEIVDQYGKEVVKYDNTGSKGRPEIDRKDLRALLLDSVPSDRIRWGCRVQKVQRQQDNSISVQFDNGCVESGFKLVVGADGTWSKARELVTPAKPLYSGLCYLQAIFGPEDEAYEYLVSKVGKGMFGGMGSGKQIVAQNLGDGSYNVYIGLRLPEDWERPEVSELKASLLQNEFADWSPELRNVLAQCKSFHSWRLWAMEPHEMSWQTVPGIALIGDAAHPSTPFVVSFIQAKCSDRFLLITVLRVRG